MTLSPSYQPRVHFSRTTLVVVAGIFSLRQFFYPFGLTNYNTYSVHHHEFEQDHPPIISTRNDTNKDEPQTWTFSSSSDPPQPHMVVSHEDLFIPLSKTRGAVLSGKNFTRKRTFSNESLTFHLAHTTKESDIGTLHWKCIESIFYHHPNAKVVLHVKNITASPFQYLIDAGYDLRIQKYSVVDLLQRLEDAGVVPADMIHRFVERIPGHMVGENWYTSETNILRLVVLHLDGGIYLDTDVIVVKPMDSLPPNTIGFQDRGKLLNGACLKFQPGEAFLRACLDEILTNYRDKPWGYNGPALLTRVYKSKTNVSEWAMQTVTRRVFQYFPYQVVRYQCLMDIDDNQVQKRLNGIREQAYAVHLNNRFTQNSIAQPGSTCDCLFRAFCLSNRACGYTPRCRALFEDVNNEPTAPNGQIPLPAVAS